MRNFLKYFSGLLLGLLIGAPIVALAAAFLVPQGGTGWTNITSGALLYGNGSSPLATTTAGSNGQYLVLLNGIPKWATASSTAAVTAVTATWPVVSSGGNTPDISWNGIATSSQITGGTLAAWNNSKSLYGVATSSIFSGTAGQVLAFLNGIWTGTATTTLTGSGVISTAFNAGTNQWTVACSTCGTGSVTSIVFGDALNGGTITTTGNVNLKSYFATSTADAIGQVMYSGSTNGWPAKVAYVATSSLTLSSAFSHSGAAGAFVGGTSGTISSVQTPAFSFPPGAQMSTTTTATTTVALGPAFFAETWNAVACWSGAGNVPYNFTDGTNDMNSLQASTTVSQFLLTSNNTFVAQEKRFIEIGPMTASYISCTISKTI